MNPDTEILDLFQQASFHFADDTGSEWDRAYWRLDRAAEIIVEQRYPLYRIKELVRTSDSLIDIDTILTRVLKQAYGQ